MLESKLESIHFLGVRTVYKNWRESRRAGTIGHKLLKDWTETTEIDRRSGDSIASLHGSGCVRVWLGGRQPTYGNIGLRLNRYFGPEIETAKRKVSS
jgi:hypothetical protein